MADPSIQAAARLADEEYFAALDAQRATILRRRIRWYAIIAVALMTMGVLGNVVSIIGRSDNQTASAILALSDLALIAVYGSVIGYLVKARPDRRRLVAMLTITTLVALAIAMPFEVVADMVRVDTWANGPSGETSRLTTMYKSVNSFGMLFCLACILVPMRPHESGRIVGLCALVFAPVLLFMAKLPSADTLRFAAMFAGYAAAGTAWSWWRYRVFDFHFRAEKLRDKYNDLSGEVMEISAELTQARRLHEALFPSQIPAGMVQVAYRYEPMREIGGDFLYINKEPAGGLTLVLIDVSGHGIPAALAVNRLHGELQRFFSHYAAPAGESGRPGHLLMSLNTYACAALAPQGVYATALVLRVEPRTDGNSGTLEWASAGHPPAVLRRAGGALEELSPTAIMLGVVDADTFDPAPQTLAFAPGDCLLAYTDGAAEARNAQGQDFGAARIRALADAQRGHKTGDLASAALDAVTTHRRARPSDDTLIVEVRSVPLPSTVKTIVAATA